MCQPLRVCQRDQDGFSRFRNRRHNRRGGWGDHFKSVSMEKGESLINCLANIDLNPVRAGLVNEPEAYRWNSMYRPTVLLTCLNFRSPVCYQFAESDFLLESPKNFSSPDNFSIFYKFFTCNRIHRVLMLMNPFA